MKKILLFALFFAIFVTVSVSAQVTIGANAAPQPGAALELRGEKGGLLLPNVSLGNATVFQLPVPAGTGDLAAAAGMIVYNTNNDMTGGQGTGVYVWVWDPVALAGKWTFNSISGSALVPVTSITVAPGKMSAHISIAPVSFG